MEFANFKFFPGLELNSRFLPLLNKFQAFSSPGKENDKIQGFQGVPGRVGTLVRLMHGFINKSVLLYNITNIRVI